MISIESLTKTYGSFLALDNISCTFNDKTVTALMGENGAGKSTLLKICAGVLSFDQGNIMIDGHSIKKNSNHIRKTIGYLPEMPYLYNRLTGKEFLLYLASLRNINQPEKKIEEFAHLLRISDALNVEINGYSKGMKQKISMIAALFHHPQNLLLDEPVWGLDPLTAKTLEQFIMKQQGTTLIATHSGSLVEKVADYVYFLVNGTIVASESVKKLLNSYTTIEESYFSITGM
jgi:ABC-2 type transport system ATP-binding protein